MCLFILAVLFCFALLYYTVYIPRTYVLVTLDKVCFLCLLVFFLFDNLTRNVSSVANKYHDDMPVAEVSTYIHCFSFFRCSAAALLGLGSGSPSGLGLGLIAVRESITLHFAVAKSYGAEHGVGGGHVRVITYAR